MFKQVAKYSLIFTLSLLLISVTGGYNFVKYCCSSCEEEGIEALTEGECLLLHEHGHGCECGEACHAQTEDLTLQNFQHENCQLKYFKIDEGLDNAGQNNISIHEPMFVLSAILPLLYSYTLGESAQILKPHFAEGDIPISSGRDILTSVCILRI